MIENIIDIIYWAWIINYIHDNKKSVYNLNSNNVLEKSSLDIEHAESIWYEIYYRYLLIYIDETLGPLFNESYYGFNIHYRQMIELDFSKIYHWLDKNDRIFID